MRGNDSDHCEIETQISTNRQRIQESLVKLLSNVNWSYQTLSTKTRERGESLVLSVIGINVDSGSACGHELQMTADLIVGDYKCFDHVLM